MASSQHITEYAPPVIRSPSPTSSIGTVYDEDRTTPAEMDLTWSELDLRVKENMELSKPRAEEILANRDPLIQRPESEPERIALFHKILDNLRKEIQKLEENDLYDQTLLRGSQVALQPPPVTNDIDILMKSMMGPGMNISHTPNADVQTGRLPASVLPNFPQASRPAKQKITPGPWNNWGKPTTHEGDGDITDEALEDEPGGILESGGKKTRRGRTR